MSKSFLAALNGETQSRPPFWFMRQAGRYLPEYREIRAEAGNFLDLCYNPKLAAEVTLQPIRRYNMDAAILFADILLIPHGLGQQLDYLEGEGPVLEPVRNLEDLKGLQLSRLDDVVSPVYETVRRVAADLPEHVALIGFAGAPWTVATYMVEGRGSRDFSYTKAWAYKDPEGFQTLIDLIIDATIHNLKQQISAGAEAVQLFDTWAGALSETGFQRWCIDPTRRITAALKADYPKVPIIGFPKGAGAAMATYAAGTGVNAVGLDWTLPLSFVRDSLQPICTVQGNLDPQLLVVGDEAMRSEAIRILDQLSGGPFVFNLGHGITPQVPPDHVADLCELLHSYRAKQA